MTKKLQAEYKKYEDFITAVVEDTTLNNAIRMTDDKRFLVTLENAHEDVKAGKEIFCSEGDIEHCVNELKESAHNWSEKITKKLHRNDYKYKHAEKTMDNVSVTTIKRVKEKYFDKGRRLVAIVRDNGRLIVAFKNKVVYEQYLIETRNKYKGDMWTQYGDEKIFTWSDEVDNYNMVVAEFWTDEKFDEEMSMDTDAMYRAHWGIQEPNDRPRSPFEVYSPSELL
ncbi:hypothetical protein [Bacillus sp. CH_203]|uniref:hypothetical protein n=1 Tax=Bacillus sp. CH_203 TaxID=2978216 RepID=UPI00289068D1|nr:hypothetical protein [Bacillus cereus]HDX9663238.1 hypothetical protein [Bacillus cereus]